MLLKIKTNEKNNTTKKYSRLPKSKNKILVK